MDKDKKPPVIANSPSEKPKGLIELSEVVEGNPDQNDIMPPPALIKTMDKTERPVLVDMFQNSMTRHSRAHTLAVRRILSFVRSLKKNVFELSKFGAPVMVTAPKNKIEYLDNDTVGYILNVFVYNDVAYQIQLKFTGNDDTRLVIRERDRDHKLDMVFKDPIVTKHGLFPEGAANSHKMEDILKTLSDLLGRAVINSPQYQERQKIRLKRIKP